MAQVRWTHVVLVAGFLALIGLLTACEVPTEIVVDSTADGVDADPGDGLCRTAAGACTLRAAFQEANAAAPTPTRIVLAAGATYELTIPRAANIRENHSDLTPELGDLDLTGRVVIEGNGATIDANGLDRIVEVRPGAELVVDRVHLVGGSARMGGAIFVKESARARVTRSTFSGNRSTGSNGFENLQRLESWNDGGGGAIRNDGQLSVVDTTFTGNTAQARTWCNSISFTVRVNCVFHGGGAILNGGDLAVLNSTFSENVVRGGSGGALANLGTARVLWTTFADNGVDPALAPPNPCTEPCDNVPDDLPGAWLFASAIANWSGYPFTWWSADASVTLGGVLVQGPGTLCEGRTDALTYGRNIASDASCFDPSDGAIGPNLTGVLVDLSPLGDHGGSTATRVPLAGSPAVDAIPSGVPGCEPGVWPDQRGVARPQGAGCDIGAVERSPGD